MRYKKEKYVEQRELKGKWLFRVRIRNVCDKTFSESEYGSSRRAFDNAVIFRDKMLNDIRLNLVVSDTNKSVRDVLLESFDIIAVREASKKCYINTFDIYMSEFNKPITKVSKVDIMMSLNKALNKGQSTLNNIMLVWRKIIKTAIIKNYIVKDITLGISAPRSTKQVNRKNVIATREEVDRVISVLSDTRRQKSYAMAVEFMYYLGLRPCETFALTKDDIKDGYVVVNKEVGSEIADSSNEIERYKLKSIRTCKTNCSVRKIPMPKELIDKYNNYVPGDNLIFPDNDGSYLTSIEFSNIMRKKGIKFNLYMLRHTLASDLVANNVDERTIIELLGHKNINMSVYYARSNDERKKDALDKR